MPGAEAKASALCVDEPGTRPQEQIPRRHSNGKLSTDRILSVDGEILHIDIEDDRRDTLSHTTPMLWSASRKQTHPRHRRRLMAGLAVIG